MGTRNNGARPVGGGTRTRSEKEESSKEISDGVNLKPRPEEERESMWVCAGYCHMP